MFGRYLKDENSTMNNKNEDLLRNLNEIVGQLLTSVQEKLLQRKLKEHQIFILQ